MIREAIKRLSLTRCVLATLLLLVLAGVVAAGASQSGGTASSPRLGGYLRGGFGNAAEQRFVADLARAGIPVFKPGSAKPIDRVVGRVSPLRLTLDQADAAALGVSVHAGLTGARLDELVRLRQGRLVVPMGAIVAGWAKRARTPAGALARRILGRPDWRRYRETVFPDAVLLLFAADVGSHLPLRSAAGSAARALSASVTGGTAGGLCTAVDGFIRNAIDGFFRSLGRLRTDPGAIRSLFGHGFFADIIAGVGDVLAWSVNTVVDALHEVVINGYRLAIGTVTSALASVAGAAAVAGSITSLLLPWAGTMSAAPNPTSKGVGTGIPGLLTLDVTALGSKLEWPDWLVGCAKLFNVTLPTLTPRNADVKWDLSQQDPAGLVVERSNTGPLDDHGRAQLRFATTAEDPELARGEPHIGAVVPFAHIHRTDLDQLDQRLTTDVLADLPTIVQKAIGPALRSILQPVLLQLQSQLAKLRDLDVAGIIAVRYHTPAPPKKKKKKVKHPPGGARGTELRYPLPDPCSLLSQSELALVIHGPIAGPHRHLSGTVGPYSHADCSWRLDSSDPSAEFEDVADVVARYPSVRSAKRFRPPSAATKLTGLGDQAFYVLAAHQLFARRANLWLDLGISPPSEGTSETLMRAMLSHLPRPVRVRVNR